MNLNITEINKLNRDDDISDFYNKNLTNNDIVIDSKCVKNNCIVGAETACQHYVMINGRILNGYFDAGEICDLYKTNNLPIPDHFKEWEDEDDIVIIG